MNYSTRMHLVDFAQSPCNALKLSNAPQIPNNLVEISNTILNL
jgi:hypothetical protein